MQVLIVFALLFSGCGHAGGQERQRDLFPLPLAKGPPGLPPPELCGSAGLDGKGTDELLGWAREATLALNQLSGQGSKQKGAPPLAASRVADSLTLEFLRMPKPPDDLTSDESALQQILQKSGIYTDARPDLATYSKDNVSWPSKGAQPVPLVDFLWPADRERLCAWEEKLLRSTDDAQTLREASGIKKPYCDATLFGSQKRYAHFLRELEDRGLLRWRIANGEVGKLGVFFVKKKDGTNRIVFDTRIINFDFVDPPATRLPSGAAISAIESPSDEEFYVATGDIQNCFYTMEVPTGLSDRFTLPTIAAGAVGKQLCQGQQVSSSPHKILRLMGIRLR